MARTRANSSVEQPILANQPTKTTGKATQATTKTKRSGTNVRGSGQEEHTQTGECPDTSNMPKRQRADSVLPDHNNEAPAPAKRRKATPKTAADTSTLRQSNRIQTNTPGPDVPIPQRKKRRTKAEIEADKARAEAVARQQEEIKREQHRQMVQMDIDEDRNRAREAAETIKYLEDLHRKSDSSVEEFEGYDNVSGSDSESSDDNGVQLAVLNQKGRRAAQKPKSGGSGKESGGGKKGAGGKKSGGGKKKEVTFASGLRPDWELNTKALPKKRTETVQISAGGLGDSDLDDVNPYGTENEPTDYKNLDDHGAKRDRSRRNEMVTILADDEEFVPMPRARAPVKKMKAATTAPQSRPTRVTEPDKRDIGAIPPKDAIPKKKRVKNLNGNNVRKSDLPTFASAKWRSSFLPTLYDKFFTSDEPFNKFAKDSNEFLAILQSIIAELYPEIDYEVTFSDSIYLLALNRINEKRSAIGSSAIKILEEELKKLKDYEHKPWLRWALRVDGPLFFKTPSPMDSPTDSDDPSYEFPQGRLLSPFIINMASPFLALRAGSVLHSGYPKGLIALIMAALERAARHLLKPAISLLEFSSVYSGSRIKTYYNGFTGVPDDRWEYLVELCEGSAEESDSGEDALEADLSVLDHKRPFMFNFASPAKARR